MLSTYKNQIIFADLLNDNFNMPNLLAKTKIFLKMMDTRRGKLEKSFDQDEFIRLLFSVCLEKG